MCHGGQSGRGRRLDGLLLVAIPGGRPDLAEAGGIQQVMLEVRVAEMSRSISKRLGINFAYVQGETFFLNMLGSLTFLDDELADLTLRVSPSIR